MKNFVTTISVLGFALVPSAILADWNGTYAGISTGMSRNGEIEITNSAVDDGIYPLEDSTIFGLHLGNLTQIGELVYGGEVDLIFAPDARFADIISLERPIIDLKGKAGFAVDRFLAYGVLGISATPATFGSNDINPAGFVIGAGFDFMITDNITLGAEYLARATSEEFLLEENADMRLDTIAVRASFKF